MDNIVWSWKSFFKEKQKPNLNHIILYIETVSQICNETPDKDAYFQLLSQQARHKKETILLTQMDFLYFLVTDETNRKPFYLQGNTENPYE